MKTADFIREHNACREGAKWALSISEDMSDVWDALVEQEKHEWLLWTATRPVLFPDSVMRELACRFVRETPIGAGRTVWDLLTDDRSRKAIEVAERYADGKAMKKELADAAFAAYDAACDADAAAYAAYDAAWADARAAAYTAACDAYLAACDTDAAAFAAAKSAQVKMIAELGNPFKKGVDK